ncbi:MAG: NAD-dependent epimerase/dehydratase family protein [Porticoccus sp.]
MKVLFIGCGDIGVRAIRALPSGSPGRAWQAQAMRRNPLALPADIDATRGDLCNIRDLLAVLGKSSVDAVVVTLTPDHMSDQGYCDSYVAGARALKLALSKSENPPRLVVWVSSSGVYGQTNGEWVDELSGVAPTSFRGKRLLEAEKIISSLSTEPLFSEDRRIKPLVVRFSGIYGPGRNRLIHQIKQGNIAAKEPTAWTNRIHSEDCARVIVHLLGRYAQNKPLENLYLATDDEPVSAYEMQRWLAKQMGVCILDGSDDKKNRRSAEFSNRRCSNKLLIQSGYKFFFPTFREGYLPLLKNEQK